MGKLATLITIYQGRVVGTSSKPGLCIDTPVTGSGMEEHILTGSIDPE